MALSITIILSIVLLTSLVLAGLPHPQMEDFGGPMCQSTYVGGRYGGLVTVRYYPIANMTKIRVPWEWEPLFPCTLGICKGRYLVDGCQTTFVFRNPGGQRVTLIRTNQERIRVFYENHTKKRILK